MYSYFSVDSIKSKNSKLKNAMVFIHDIMNSCPRPEQQVFIYEDGNKIKFKLDMHHIEVRLNKNYEGHIFSHSLPESCNLIKAGRTIDYYFDQFIELVNQLERFYSELNTIDELCDVIDPLDFNTKCCHRVIRIDDRVYLKININPMMPSSASVNFYGPTDLVEKYKHRYSSKLNDWNVEENIYRNLTRIFDLVALPGKKTSAPDYCKICYLHRLYDEVPLISCDNGKCDDFYHAVCLREWFISLQGPKNFLNVMCGDCPSCNTKISASFAKLICMNNEVDSHGKF